MTSNGGRDRGFQELNHHVKEKCERSENGIVGDSHRPGFFRDGELRIDKVDEDIKDRGGQLVQGQVVVQAPQLQPQGSLVHWERFLHVRSIKVMLVENDDSTRHIVTALLRNCNYEVIEAANGLQAWKILEDHNNHVDIVLTEVVMPILSGVGLLCKIMSHKTRKNIPVIMMSSRDSMGLVFKCLSKGAVDFLVKPIRKNELKNLWQHVWRRCHSSSGSGSESGTQTQKSVKSKSSARSDKNSGSYDGDDNRSNGLDTGDGSDDGSGTQSSWTKQAVEVGSSRAVSQWGQKAECPDSTCGQVIRSNVEAPRTRDIHGQEQLENVAKGKELVMGESRNPVGGECSSHKHKAVGPNRRQDDGEFEALREPANMKIKNNITDDSNEEAAIELSLKRFRGVKDTDRAVHYDLNVLGHSELSAFSRYNTTGKAFEAPNGITRSSSQLDNRLEITKKESMCDVQSRSDGHVVNQSFNGVGNNIDVGSTSDKLYINPVVLKDKSEVTFAINCLHPSSAFRPIKADIKSSSQLVVPGKTDDVAMAPNDTLDPPGDTHHELPIQHIHHHHHVHHYHDMEGGQQSLSNHDDLSLKRLAADAPRCGSSNVLGGPVVEGNPGNYSLNRSASGSKHGSNGQNGSSTAVNAGGTNVESIVGVAPKNRNGDDSGSGCGNGIDQSKSAQREAALTKFRQKRKERCFQKKVQYQNRKRLAEQRPRIRGQFVRQTGHTDNSSSSADS